MAVAFGFAAFAGVLAFGWARYSRQSRTLALAVVGCVVFLVLGNLLFGLRASLFGAIDGQGIPVEDYIVIGAINIGAIAGTAVGVVLRRRAD